MPSNTKYKAKPNPKKEGIHILWFTVVAVVLILGLMSVFEPYQPPPHPSVMAANEQEEMAP